MISSEAGSTAAQDDPSVGQLLSRLSEQTSRLVRDEIALAKSELRDSAKHAGIGAGLLAGAAVLALFGAGVVVTTAIVALDLVLPLWLSALIVAVVLLAAAGLAAVMGRGQLKKAPPSPELAASFKRDIDDVKEATHREHNA
ncbi:MAG: phage holin family protein [Mycobacteriaceae bacterium]